MTVGVRTDEAFNWHRYNKSLQVTSPQASVARIFRRAVSPTRGTSRVYRPTSSEVRDTLIFMNKPG